MISSLNLILRKKYRKKYLLDTGEDLPNSASPLSFFVVIADLIRNPLRNATTLRFFCKNLRKPLSHKKNGIPEHEDSAYICNFICNNIIFSRNEPGRSGADAVHKRNAGRVLRCDADRVLRCIQLHNRSGSEYKLCAE